MIRNNHLSRRGFLAGSTAAALSIMYLPGIGRVQAQPNRPHRAEDFTGRLCYNENPLGPSPAALAAMQDSATITHRYPDWFNSGLETQIAALHGLSASHICAGAGATEMIRRVADALLGPGDEMITATPTYTQMGNEAIANGTTVVHVPLTVDHVIDLSAILAAVSPSTRMISLVNPNNPLATIVDKTDLEGFIDTLPSDIVVVVDEAYHEYVHSAAYESCLRYVVEAKPVIVIKTLSKVYGLAGARIGYTIADPSYTSLIGSSQLFGMISRPSQAAAEAALADTGHVTSTVDLNDQAKAMLETGLTDLGLSFIPSHTNFLMFDTGTDAGAISSQLLSLGYQVRTGWSMPQHIRVSTGTLEEMQGFLDALEGILVTGVPSDQGVPHSLAVAAAYPNPFNATCRLRVTIPGTESVNLTIYDMAGRKIQTLVQGPLAQGTHELMWDGKNHGGQTVAAGTYILNLVQGELAASSKISFVK